MAFSSEKVAEGQISGLKVQLWTWNAASVNEGIIRTGLSNVRIALHNNDTTEADGKIQKNKSAASTVEQGAIFLSSVTSNDVGEMLVIGN